MLITVECLQEFNYCIIAIINYNYDLWVNLLRIESILAGSSAKSRNFFQHYNYYFTGLLKQPFLCGHKIDAHVQ